MGVGTRGEVYVCVGGYVCECVCVSGTVCSRVEVLVNSGSVYLNYRYQTQEFE